MKVRYKNVEMQGEPFELFQFYMFMKFEKKIKDDMEEDIKDSLHTIDFDKYRVSDEFNFTIDEKDHKTIKKLFDDLAYEEYTKKKEED